MRSRQDNALLQKEVYTPAYQLISGRASVVGTNLNILGGGSITVQVSQTGNTNYNAASTITRVIDVRLRPDIQIRPGGTVLREPETPTVPYGQSLVLTALPNDGFLFDGWTGDVNSKVNPLSITVTNNVKIIPVFTPVWTLSVTNTPGGSVIVEPALNSIKNGTRVVATAIPDDSYGFRGWKGTFTSTENPLNFVFDTNTTLIAEFNRLVKISPKQTEGGSVAVSPVLSQYVLGNSVKVTASALEGYRFQGWKDPFDGLTNGSSITLTNDIVLEGFFKKLQKVAVSQSGEGTVVSTGRNSPNQGFSAVLKKREGFESVVEVWDSGGISFWRAQILA